MSILIKGMDMPKNCLECVFYRQTDPVYDYCCISSAAPKGYVPNDCPLIEVPPHGRLIDADKAAKQGWTISRTYSASPTEMVYEAKTMTDEVLPTIIEAEENSND